MISVVIISKDEASLDSTLTELASQVDALPEPGEIVVVDASGGRLDHIRDRHEPTVRWVPFKQAPDVRVSIPHQRNAGVRAALGEIVAFTDAGCRPEPGWLSHLIDPLRQEDSVAAGVTLPSQETGLYYSPEQIAALPKYVTAAGTGNFAFRREAFDAVGGFDEAFAYGSDTDFCWRLTDAGYLIRSVPEAVVRHDYGTWWRQLRRSYVYGMARARLYRKHKQRFRYVLRDDPVMVVYPLFLLGLPLTLIFPFYPLLLLIPAWRNRSYGPMRAVVDHLSFGAGVLAELVSRWN
jgi:cellulose synthase/poly-beta-1,6-N-acetylglucosamine synthase-like glycosyltransferase